MVAKKRENDANENKIKQIYRAMGAKLCYRRWVAQKLATTK